MTPVRPPESEAPWDELAQALERFAAATGMCTSGYDASGRRRCGPFYSRRVAGLMERSNAFADGGHATAVERRLSARSMANGAAASEMVDELLRVRAQPVVRDRPDAGSAVFGWVLGTFPTSLGSAKLARTLGVDAALLWGEARLEAPVAEASMHVSSQLLETLLDGITQHAQAIGQLHEMARMREDFLARVSHELRTPLSALLVRAEVLLRSPLDDAAKIRREVEKMKRHVAEQSRLVEDLIDAARTQTGQLSITRQPLAVSTLLAQAVDLVRPVAQAKGVALHAPEPSSVDRIAVLADPDRLRQVVTNLLANAVKFTPGSGSVRVTVHATADSVNVAVADDGAGIDAAVLPFIFNPFTKKSEGNAAGLGLGLAIAKQIVELHGGSIKVRSDGPGQGSTFHVALPRYRDLRSA